MPRRRGDDRIEEAGGHRPRRRKDDRFRPKQLTVREANVKPADASIEGDDRRVRPNLDQPGPLDRLDQGSAELAHPAGQADER